MIYFFTKFRTDGGPSGVLMRCKMIYSYIKNEYGDSVKLVNLYNYKASLLESLIMKIFPTHLLPLSTKLRLFFISNSLFDWYDYSGEISKNIEICMQNKFEIFIFRAYILHIVPLEILDKLFKSGIKVHIDFDESDFHTIESFYKNNKNWNSIKNFVREREKYLLSTNHITVYFANDQEVERLKQIYSITAKVKVFPNKLDIEPDLIFKEKSSEIHFLIIGNFSYLPNAEMVQKTYDLILKYEKLNHIFIFHIVGRGICKKLSLKMKKMSNVKIYGSISNSELEKLYLMIDFNLVPIFSGGGTKYKVIESLAHGIPSIGTDEAFSGLGLTENIHFIKFKPEIFESDVMLVYNDRNKYHYMQKKCKNHYLTNFYYKSN